MHPWPGYIRALTYPILFEAKPVDGLERALTSVVDKGKSGSRQDFLSAIDQALASKDDLAKMFSEDHTDAVIREFLVEAAKAIRARPPLP